ncbi:unnamed protein product [Protopolystoma xenopodis]|uniref:Uncharacterized protein n=1 Tax=Protopolystoma xenopodis TaxID=117903 RepID=A0A448XS77_9PLAT|nr:unnamed protein product [Protopolystoma xenopodis]
MAKLTDDADYEAGETSENVSSPRSDARNQDNYYGRRLRDAGETFENVSSPLSDAGNHDNYYSRRRMAAKRLRMYQVHCQMLGIMTTTMSD